MEEKSKTAELLIRHFNAYPLLEIRDIFKFLFQSSFGCEHLISSEENVIQGIAEEARSLKGACSAFTEELDGDYDRVHLSVLGEGMKPETFGRLFFLSAKKEADGYSCLEKKLTIANELVKYGTLPFSYEEFTNKMDEWRKKGYPPIRHSDTFKKAYCPSYRVISKDFTPFLPLFIKLDSMLKSSPVKLAIEGGSASGKSTLADILTEVYDCTVFHADDFFLRPEQRTKERFAEPGGNFDRERFLNEILEPLRRGNEISYRKFDCSDFTLKEPTRITAKRLKVIEGTYSMHPELEKYYDISVFLQIDPEKQKKRILKRNGESMAQRFFNEWIPLEQKYFDAFHVKSKCDMIFEIN
ncbi:MAG: hypothetical protein E7623_02785 [Ruminococcaceae bacterium]|nr:hypothetical protein [Oscillospiraceae bacterium]